MSLFLSLLEGVTQPLGEAVQQAANTAGSAGEAATQAAQQSGGGLGMIGMVAYILFFVAIFYFFIIKPQRKKDKQLKEIQESIKVGDEVMTSSGFFGVVADLQDDVAVIEFGTNKGVRIPVKRSEIYGNKSNNKTESK